MGGPMKLVHKAILYAVAAHDAQYRKDIEVPYITHPIAVMHAAARLGVRDEQFLAACLLHDVFEDTCMKYGVIYQEFGSQVASLVKEVTRVDNATQTDKDEYMASFAGKSIDAVVLKIIDRLDNVVDFKAAGKDSYANKYFWKAECVFDLLDSRRQEIVARFSEDFHANLVAEARATMRAVEI